MDVGQPDGEGVVRMVGEVVADQVVEALVVAVDVGGGDGDDLAISRRGGDGRGLRQRATRSVAHRGGDEPLDRGVVGVVGHIAMVERVPDDGLTVS
jgi:hypothetical protein